MYFDEYGNGKIPDEIIAGAEKSVEKEENTPMPDLDRGKKQLKDRVIYFNEST